MVYLVFDMDATLTDLSSIHVLLWELEDREHNILINEIYKLLIKKVLALELSDKPLGILVPGILDIMKEAKRCKDAGKVEGVVIYSNNSVSTSLCFIRDLIHSYLKSNDLIVDLIHRGHPTRYLAGEELQTAAPNTFPKTWKTLKRILIEGPAKAPKTIEPKDVIFIDDVLHTDLRRELPLKNYVHIAPYIFRCSFDNVANIYLDCLDELDILNNDVLLRRYIDSIKKYDNSIQSKTLSNDNVYFHLENVGKIIGYYVKINTPPPPKNKAVLNSILRAFSPEAVAIGGRNKRKRTRRRGRHQVF